jgi:hypothetical protein
VAARKVGGKNEEKFSTAARRRFSVLEMPLLRRVQERSFQA